MRLNFSLQKSSTGQRIFHRLTHNFNPSTVNGHQIADMFTPPNSKTMIMSRSIDHDFELYDGAQSVPSLSRQKSESIMIKRSRGYDDSVDDDNYTQRKYDYATWSMYHLITSARKARGVPPILNNHGGASIPAFKIHTDSSRTNLHDDSLLSIDYSHLGEVFEIEL